MRFSHPTHLVPSLLAFLLYFWPATIAADDPKVQIDWVDGPITARLGDIAEIKLSAGYSFTGREGTRKFLELTQNPPGGNELGTTVPITSHSDDAESKDSGSWFVIFEFNDVGYVKDDDRDKLDPDALLKSISDNTENSNDERAKRGWPAYHVTRWYKPPF